MAKMNGLGSTLRGKSGGYVFAKGLHGETIVRQYQSQVYNPNTLAQRKQRLKMNLVGQLSKVFKQKAIEGLGGRPALTRIAFNKNLFRVMPQVADPTNGIMISQLGWRHIILSKGNAVNAFTAEYAAPTTGRDGAQIVVTLTPRSTMLAGMFGRIVAVAVPSADWSGGEVVSDDSCVVKDFVVTNPDVTAGHVTVNLVVPIEGAVSSYYYAVYYIPMGLSENATMQYAQLAGSVEGAADLYSANSALTVGDVVSTGNAEFGNSVMLNQASA